LKASSEIFSSLKIGLVVLVCGLVFLHYGWIAYAVFTNRSGLYGNLYWYYRMDKTIFAVCQAIISIFSLLILIRLIYLSLLDNRKKLKGLFIQFLVFILILFAFELYLGDRYVGKG
jgi:hypothetical protein